MAKPKNLSYGFEGTIERDLLMGTIIPTMDDITAKLPITENMNSENMLRCIKFTGVPQPPHYEVRDIQNSNKAGKREVDYFCYVEKDGAISVRERDWREVYRL